MVESWFVHLTKISIQDKTSPEIKVNLDQQPQQQPLIMLNGEDKTVRYLVPIPSHNENNQGWDLEAF